jgi:hypothetical protein
VWWQGTSQAGEECTRVAAVEGRLGRDGAPALNTGMRLGGVWSIVCALRSGFKSLVDQNLDWTIETNGPQMLRMKTIPKVSQLVARILCRLNPRRSAYGLAAAEPFEWFGWMGQSEVIP